MITRFNIEAVPRVWNPDRETHSSIAAEHGGTRTSKSLVRRHRSRRTAESPPQPGWSTSHRTANRHKPGKACIAVVQPSPTNEVSAEDSSFKLQSVVATQRHQISMAVNGAVLQGRSYGCQCGVPRSQGVPHDFTDKGMMFADVIASPINQAPTDLGVGRRLTQRRTHSKSSIAVEPVYLLGLILCPKRNNTKKQQHQDGAGLFSPISHLRLLPQCTCFSQNVTGKTGRSIRPRSLEEPLFDVEISLFQQTLTASDRSCSSAHVPTVRELPHGSVCPRAPERRGTADARRTAKESWLRGKT